MLIPIRTEHSYYFGRPYEMSFFFFHLVAPELNRIEAPFPGMGEGSVLHI
jgi:hypothetical protein